MGIFEKSIPKYVVNPIDQQLEVAPQDVYVDDIFDPIFNARVKDAMRQKYGSGLYGVLGGYEEMLKNAWGGDGGILGKGMGVLSTFGRSMEKADDLVLGLLTEGVEGITGQGFDNPFKQIFVEDEDYTGKRLLAATANTFRGLAGGTTVTEQDFGPEWNIPALGLELTTDVGILGGGLARKLAPTAREFTSKELFQRLGKSDVKTTVGEIGQLMSNYDDLMTRVAIDATAPGLRPAFKKLSNSLVQHLATQAPREFIDYKILKSDPKVRKAARDYFDKHPFVRMAVQLSNTADELPVSQAEVAVDAAKTEEELIQEALDNEQLAYFNYIKELVESDDYANFGEDLRKYSLQRSKELGVSYDDYIKTQSDAVNKLFENMANAGMLDQIGIDQWSDEIPASLKTISDLKKWLHAADRLDVDLALKQAEDVGEYIPGFGWTVESSPVKESVEKTQSAKQSLDEIRKVVSDALGIKKTPEAPLLGVDYATDFKKRYPDFDNLPQRDRSRILKEEFSKFPQVVQENIDKYEKIFNPGSLFTTTSGFSEAPYGGIPLVNESYVDEVLEKLRDDSTLMDALETGEWSTNDATNKAINAALGDPANKHYAWYALTNSKYSISPSRITAVEALGPGGTNYAYDRLDAARYSFRNPGAPRFTTEEELVKYLNTPRMRLALEEYFPKTNATMRPVNLNDPVVKEALANASHPEYADFIAAGMRPVRLEDYLKYVGLDTDKIPPDVLSQITNLDETMSPEYVWLRSQWEPKLSLDELRQSIVDVYFPKGKKDAPQDLLTYTASLEKLSRILDDSKMTRISDDIVKAAPDESAFLEDLYKAFDDSAVVSDVAKESLPKITRKQRRQLIKEGVLERTEYYGIDQVYLQRLWNERPSSKGARKTADTPTYAHRESVVDDISGTSTSTRPSLISDGNAAKGVRDDLSLSYDSYVKSALSQIASKVKSEDEFYSIIEPILPYYHIKPKNSSNTIDEIRQNLARTLGTTADKIADADVIKALPKHRLVPTATTVADVNAFRDLIPSINAYLKKGGNPFGNKPKDITWREHYTVRRWLGLKDDPNYLAQNRIPLTEVPSGYANRLMYEALYDKTTNLLRVPSTDLDRIVLEDAAMRAHLSQGRLTKSTVKFDNAFAQVIQKYRKDPKTFKSPDELAREVRASIEASKPVTVAQQAFDNASTAAATAENTVDELAGNMKRFRIKGGSKRLGETLYGKRRWRWFEIIRDALSVSDKNARREARATIRTKIASLLGKRFSDLTIRIAAKGDFKNFKRFYILRQQQLGDIVKGSDFWTTFRRTGILIAPYLDSSKQLPIVEASLKNNAELINKAAGKDIVEVVTQDYGTTRKAVIMRFTGDKNTVKYVKSAQKKLDSTKFEDVMFSPPVALSESDRKFMDSEDMRELAGMMDELQAVAADQAKLLGFTFDNATPYTHHAMHRSTEMANWLNGQFYSKVSSEDYDELSKLISNFDAYRKTDRGAFGTMLQDRRYRGDYWLLDDTDIPGRMLFDYSPERIFTSTLADGMFANLQYQDFVDLFVNDNFKIKDWFKTPEDLKKVLYATDSKGRLSGNFANSELVSFKLDENGKISGLVKYDKSTDSGLAKALADENTILVPANAISHMDNVLRKDVRMGNKFWTFINKHFTIPFKFGLLSNPGFLLGNISDSTFKLATTMSEKYGTSFTKEAQNVAECINASQALKNSYYEAFDVWKKVSAEYDIKLSPEATVADIVAMSPKYKEDFLKWLDDRLEVDITYQNEAGMYITETRHVPCDLDSDTINNASIWTMLQGVQMNSSKLREYSELAEITPSSKYDVATNAWDRVTQGSGAYDKKNWRTWGLFMNNPYMKKLTDASGAWEDIIRTASILDDLRHGQYSKEDFAKFARGSKGSEDSILYRVRLDEAKNTMFNAQFDYERQSDFISKIGKTVPFPIFFLKNFEYWMDVFDKNPQFIDNVIDVQEGLWSGYNEDNDKFMTEAKGRGALPVGAKALPDWFKGVYKPSPLQSMFGAFSLLNDPVDNLSYRVNPLVGGAKAAAVEALPDSELTTLLSDPESVKYRPYSGDMYERNIKQGDPEFNPLYYTLHRANPYDRALNAQMRIPEKLKEGEFQLSDALPSVFQPMF